MTSDEALQQTKHAARATTPILDLAAKMALDKQRAYDHLQDFHAEVREALRTIIAARDLAPDEPIPTPLLAAIEDARRVL